MIYDLAIIGGGVSGISAYINALRRFQDKKVIIIEHNDNPLKKLNLTGNGKCNFTNGYLNYNFFNNGKYFKELLNDKSYFKVLEFFDYLNIKYKVDKENRYYPLSETAKTVVNKMMDKVAKNDLLLKTNIYDIKIEDNKYILYYENGTIEAKKLLISVGSINYSNTGSDGSLFELIKKLGHNITPIYPSNIWINVKEKNITKALTGLRIKANLTLINNNEVIKEEYGELLFKDNALSGIVSFNISNQISELYKTNNIKNTKIIVDFIPSYEKIDEDIYSYIHPTIANVLLKEEKKYKNINDLFKKYEFNVESLGEIKYAQVTSGGVNLNEINTNTFESLLHKNLYFSGDVLDISAPCGGFNLSFAILSGLKVGEEIE